MAWSFALAAALVLNPVLDEAGPVRLVASGTADQTVQWSVDGHDVATTGDGEPHQITLSAGRHEVRAESPFEGRWRALVRPDPDHADGAAYVDGWMAEHVPAPPGRDDEDDRSPLGPASAIAQGPALWAVAAAALVLALWPGRRGGRGRRRPKGP